MTNKQIQIVAFNNPYPANFGGAIDMFYKIKALHQNNVDIILHLFYKDRTDITGLESYCSQIYMYKQNTGLINHFSKKPYSSIGRINKVLTHRLKSVNAPIFIESLRCCEILNKINFEQKVAVRTHNIEHLYSKGLSSSSTNAIEKLAHYLEALKQKDYEKILNKADILFNISIDEHNYFKQKYIPESVFLPVFTGFNSIASLNGFGKYALYHGDLSTSDNLKSAIFLIELFKNLPYKFIIASSYVDKRVSAAISNCKNIEFIIIKNFEHLSQLVQNAHVQTLYSFQKSGTKLKVFNSLFNGRHCIINSNIVDDPDIKNVCHVSETKLEYKNKIEQLFKEEFILSDKRIKALSKYNDFKNAKRIVEALF